MVRPPFRTKTVSTKVSEEEFRHLEVAASKGGQSVSEWCREVLLASLNGQPANGSRRDAGAETLMAEVVAMRAILLNVLFKLANGERITPQEMQRLIDRVDSEKVRKARERLEQVLDSKQG